MIITKMAAAYLDVVTLAVQVGSHLLSNLIPLLLTERIIDHLAAVSQCVMHCQLSLQQ